MIKNIIMGILAVAVIILLATAFFLSGKVKEKDGRLYALDSLHRIDSTQWAQYAEDARNEKELRKQLEVQNKKLSEQSSIKDETITLLNKTVLRLKSVTKTKIINDTIFQVTYVEDTTGAGEDYLKVPIGGDIIEFEDDYSSFLTVRGRTQLYPDKSWTLEYQGKELVLDIVYTEDENGISRGYIDTNDPILSVLSFKTKVNRNTNKEKSFWSRFGGILGANFTRDFSFVNGGINFDWIGLNGLAGLNYNDNSHFFGAGIYFHW